MTRKFITAGVFCTAAVLTLAVAPRMLGQATAPAPAPAPGTAAETPEETVKLNPFIVSADEDQGYQATATLAGTRVRTDLKDVASSISVVTQQFLQDTSSKNSQDLFVYTTNTEVGGISGNFSGQAAQVIYTEPLINPNGNNRVRGLDAADNTRNYFRTFIPWDSFNVGRVDLQRGPNSVLFGVGSPAGIVNASLNDATFKNAYKFENHYSSYGSWRNQIDLNQVLLPGELAIRFAAVADDQKFQQRPAYNNTTRYYAALRFEPKLFNLAGSHTSIRVNFEGGKVKSNNPRQLPPDDQITPWFLTGNDAHGIPALNKVVVDENIRGQGANSAFVNTSVNRSSWAMGRVYWPIPIAYYNGSDPAHPGLVPSVLSGTPSQVIIGEWTTGWAINNGGTIAPPNQPGQSTNNGIGGLVNFQPKAVPNYAHFASGALPGGSYYANKVLTDPSVFDFYNNLLDGQNKHEWQKWNALNFALSQTFLDDRVGFELAFDKETYSNGQIGFMGGENYAINVDINATMIDGSRNPNLGRPYVSAGGESSNNSNKYENNSTRLTAFGELRAEDFLGKTYLAKMLGRHVFTGLLSLDHQKQTTVSWSQYALDPGWSTLNNFDLSVKIANYRLFDWVDYIGPSLQGATSAHNARLSPIVNTIAPPTTSSVRWFDSHWRFSLNPSDPTYVNPAATAAPTTVATAGFINVGGQYYDPAGFYAPGHSPADALANPGTHIYSYLNSDNTDVSQEQRNNQASNPANYVGFRNVPVTWMNANNPQDYPSMVTGGTKARYRDLAKALVWQGYMLDEEYTGAVVGTYAWRKDSITTYTTGAPIESATAVAALDYNDDPTSRLTTEGQTRTWGFVYHLPRILTKHLPGDTQLSVFYNKGQNFNAGSPRLDFGGSQISNPTGMTKEYGASISTLADKIMLKVTHYETTVQNATLNSNAVAGLGGLSYFVWAMPSWGYGYAAQVQAGLDGLWGNTTLNGSGVRTNGADDTAGGTRWNYPARDAQSLNSSADMSVIGTPAGAANVPVATYAYTGTGTVTMTQIVNAWLHLPVADNFFSFWGITGNRPNPAQTHATGKLYLGFNQPWVAGGDVPGVGGQQPSGAQNIVSTVDNVSKGWEYELTAQPTKNWNIQVNYSRTAATKNNIDPVTAQFMAANLAFYSGPGGQLRLWGASQTAGYGAVDNPGQFPIRYQWTPGVDNGSTIGQKWINGVYNPYLVTATAQGQSAPEVSPWRLNVVTTYNFDHGMAKGAFIGGGLRMEAGRILGYRLNADNSILDVHQQLIGPNDRYFDLWVGYNKKIEAFTAKVNWRIQLNLRNVGTKSKLVPARYEPDGSLALARIQQGMTWELTNAFEF